jgi:hypothetical protein
MRVRTPSAGGEVVFTGNVWRGLKIRRSRVARAAFRPEQVAEVKAVACEPLTQGARSRGALRLTPIGSYRARDLRGVAVDDRAMVTPGTRSARQYRFWIFPIDPDFAEQAGRILGLFAGRWHSALTASDRSFRGMVTLGRRPHPVPLDPLSFAAASPSAVTLGS